MSRMQATTPIRALWVTTFIAITLAGAQAGAAPAEGFITLENLPPDAFVYADGKPATPEAGRLRLPPGEHQLQVEAASGDRVMAGLLSVTVVAGQDQRVQLKLAPVYSGFARIPAPRGPRGPEGPPGPAMAPGRATAYRPEEAMAAVIDETRRTVADLLGRLDRLRAKLPAANSTSYYCVEGCRIIQGPQGPPGPPGPPGYPPPSPDLSMWIKDNQGRVVFSEAGRVLGLPRLQQAITGMEKFAESMQLVAKPPPPNAIKIYTASLQARVSEQKKRGDEFEQALKTGEAVLGDEVGPVGPPGPRGTMGPVTALPFPAPEEIRKPPPETRLSAEQAEYLWDQLRADEALKYMLIAVESEMKQLATELRGATVRFK